MSQSSRVCDKCGRLGGHHLHLLIERYGIDAKLFDRSDEITRRRATFVPGAPDLRMDGVLCLPDPIRSKPLLKGNSDQERLPFALNEAIAETL
jgi:hypothetical protein